MHVPVLLKETLSVLSTACSAKRHRLFCDATFGEGGLSRSILASFDNVSVLAIDRDAEALERSTELRSSYPERFVCVHSPFSRIDKVLQRQSLFASNQLDGTIFDLGMCSTQIDDHSRGFSFQADGPLDMRMDQQNTRIRAYDVVNFYSRSKLQEIFKNISEAIASSRALQHLQRTSELAKIIDDSLPAAADFYLRQRTKARIFQAVRIEVNDEISEIKEALLAAAKNSSPGAYIIAEDQVAKRIFNSLGKSPSSGVLITPTVDEIKENSRARSAKLRYIRVS